MTSWRLGTRLFVAQAIVLLAIVLTAGLVAAIVGPPLFHDHLVQAGFPEHSIEVLHMERAFTDASTIALGAGLLVALACALVVSWYLTRRIGQPVHLLTEAAGRIARGDYSTRVTDARGGPELVLLGESFNVMSDRLGNVETTRRRLLSDLAHELRTPIATLNAHLEGLADGVIAWDDQTLTILEHQAERLTRLARDLDEVSRAEEGRMLLEVDDHRVSDLVAASLGQVQQAYSRKGVELTGTAEEAMVRADPQRVGQILGNLLVNALRHTPPGGSVSVVGAASADSVMITVADTGQGITAEQLHHVFERFYRGDAAREADQGGSGIGLTVARALAEAHGGSLTATSAGRGMGATFVLRLPRRS
ncbi:sensor histidine kinase [Propionibacteriaceae bacterium Y1923]